MSGSWLLGRKDRLPAGTRQGRDRQGLQPGRATPLPSAPGQAPPTPRLHRGTALWIWGAAALLGRPGSGVPWGLCSELPAREAGGSRSGEDVAQGPVSAHPTLGDPV